MRDDRNIGETQGTVLLVLSKSPMISSLRGEDTWLGSHARRAVLSITM